MLVYAHSTHFLHMRIFFGCTAAELLKYKKYYFSIRNFLIADGHILTRDWLPHALERIKKGNRTYDPKQIFQGVQKSLNDSDLVIVEDTGSNFSTG